MAFKARWKFIKLSSSSGKGKYAFVKRLVLLQLISHLRKEPKLYLAFPFRSFFCDSLLTHPDIGALREEFFVNHAYPETCYLKGARGQKTSDFMLDGKTVEAGGAGKGAHQSPDFIMKEGDEFTGKSMPLFLAGYLY